MGLNLKDKRRLKELFTDELDKCTVVSLGLDQGELGYLADDLVRVAEIEIERLGLDYQPSTGPAEIEGDEFGPLDNLGPHTVSLGEYSL